MKHLAGWTAAVAIAGAVTVGAFQLPLCRFAEEDITIDVWPQEVVVSGVYRYENPLPFPVRQTLLTPLPVDSDHPEPYAIDATPCHLVRVMGRYQCEMELRSSGAAVLSLRYRQYAPKHTARYLLTTTAPWRRPLRLGRYRIVPHGITITGSNYPLEFSRRNFMPHEDWQLSWHAD